MPTDILNAGHRLLGLGADFLTVRESARVEAFVGATSTRYDDPLFQGVRANEPAAALLLTRRLTPHITLASQVVYAHL